MYDFSHFPFLSQSVYTMNQPFDLYLVTGNITLFCGKHSDAFKTDLLHSSLYSHMLAAKSASNRELLWSTYNNTLAKIGWSQNSNTYKRVEQPVSSLLNIIKGTTQHLISDTERQSLACSFSQLANLPRDSSAIQLYLKRLHANSTNKQDADTRPTSVKKTPWNSSMTVTIIRENGTIITTLVAFQATAMDELEILNGAPVKLTLDSKNNIMVSSSFLDETNYRTFRQAITGKVQNKLDTELVHISQLLPD